MRVLAVDHGEDVRAELFGDWIRAAGHELAEWHLPAGGPAPAADAVVVLGGQMNVGEEDRHPWLEREYELLRGWVGDGTPLLGICLGAQTLAHALGGRVGPAPERLAGFVATELTPAGIADPVLGALPPCFEALHANGYRFEIPPGAQELARGARAHGPGGHGGPVEQAFRAGAPGASSSTPRLAATSSSAGSRAGRASTCAPPPGSSTRSSPPGRRSAGACARRSSRLRPARLDRVAALHAPAGA